MSRKAIVILHGWNLSGSRYAPLSALLKNAGFSVYSPDFPGFGAEPAPEFPWHVSDYAGFLKRYLTERHIVAPIIIGHSFGGRVALKVSELHPGSISAMILTGTPGFSPVPAAKMRIFMFIAKIGGVVFAIPGISFFAEKARRFLYRLAGAHEFYRAEGSMRQTFKNTVSDDLERAMRSVGCRCLLVWGDNDVIVPVTVAERMKSVIPGSRLTVVRAAGHGLPFDKPDAFLGAIRSFIHI